MLNPQNIIRSNRKTLALFINSEGELIIKAPLKLSDRRIFDFVADKEGWIRSQQEKIRANSFINPRVLSYNVFLFLGREVTPVISYKAKKIVRVDDMLHIPAKIVTRAEQSGTDSDTLIVKKASKYLKDNAKLIIEERANYFSQLMRLEHKSISTMNNRSRWGVCTRDGKISLNWRTIMLPPRLLDYILVHEFCHLLEFNHTKQFWAIVESILPNWKDLRKELKQLNYLVDLFR